MAQGNAATAAEAEVTPVEAAFRHTIDWFKSIDLGNRLDEEGVTSALLGGVTATFPLMVEQMGSGWDGETTCAWGQFSKYRTSDEAMNESDTGADFALVLWESAESVRICVFQAKHGAVSRMKSTRDHVMLDVHRRQAKPEAGGYWRESQMARLARTGLIIERAVTRYREKGSPADDAAAKACRDQAVAEVAGRGGLAKPTVPARRLSIRRLGWIYYLAYAKNAMRCVPLSSLTEAYDRECKRNAAGVNKVDIDAFDPTPEELTSLISYMLPAGSEQADERWATVPTAILPHVIPDLLEITPVFVGDGRSGRTLAFKEAFVQAAILAKPSNTAQITLARKYRPS